MDSPPRGPRTKTTARKSTGSKPPRAVLAAEAKKRKANTAFEDDATGAGLDASNGLPKKRRAPSKKTAVLKAEKQAAVGHSNKPEAQHKSKVPSQGTRRLKTLCESARTSQTTAQGDLVQLLIEVEDFETQFDAALEDLANAHAEINALRESNQELTREDMELRAEKERLLCENAWLSQYTAGARPYC